MPRKRKAIRKDDYLAAALACLLCQEHRDELRAAKVPAKAVLKLFSPDHIVLHSFGGSDEWWNLNPKLRVQHKEKSKRDTSIAAKAKRIDEKWAKFVGTALKPNKKLKKLLRSKWPSRPFDRRKKDATSTIRSANRRIKVPSRRG